MVEFAFDIDLDATGDSSVTVTAAEVVEEGQLQYAYFPNCADASAMNTLIGKWITAASARVRRQVGTSNWESSDSDTVQHIHDAVLNMVLARAWAVILNVMLTYDAEALPPEYVDPAACAEQRNFYAREARDVMMEFDTKAASSNFVGIFTSTAVDEDEESVLGATY